MASRQYTFSWAKDSSQGITGYNVYLVEGSPPNTTKTLLAYIASPDTVSYTYNCPDENAQYQFEVRATDGTNEKAPTEVFYPDGTSVYTPTVITPTGKPMMICRDVAYLTKDEFITYPSGLKLTASSTLYTGGYLDTVLETASEQVNRYCRRHFNVQTVDEIYHGIRIGQDAPKLITIPLNEGPIHNINRIDIQVLKWFVNISLDYLQVFPEQGFIQITPFLGANYYSGVPLPSAMLLEGLLGKIWVNYTFGYDVVPSAVKQATAILATKIIGLQENPVSAKSISIGRSLTLNWDIGHDPLMEQAKSLLKPYILNTYRRP